MLHTIGFHLSEILEKKHWQGRSEVNLGPGIGGEKCLGVMEMFCILIVTWLYICQNLLKCSQNGWIVSYVNHISKQYTLTSKNKDIY